MNFWFDKRVLVTGATGFVGFWLTRKLVQEGALVTVLVRDHDFQSELFRSGLIHHVSVVSGTLGDYETLERSLSENEIEAVFHLAAQTIVGTAKKAPLITFEANVRGTYFLLEACRRQEKTVKRIVIASSDKAYGSSAILPYKEKMPLMGQFPYDVSKSCCDLIAQSYFYTYGLPITIARCGNIYGGGDLNWSRLIPGTIKNLLSHQAPLIRSDGNFIRDYLYVEDAVSAYLLLGEKTDEHGIQGEAFNFAPSRPHTVLEVVQTLQTIMGTKLAPRILNEATAEIRDQFLSSSKAESYLHWKPNYSLEEGLKRTVDWYDSFLRNKHSQANLSYALN